MRVVYVGGSRGRIDSDSAPASGSSSAVACGSASETVTVAADVVTADVASDDDVVTTADVATAVVVDSDDVAITADVAVTDGGAAGGTCNGKAGSGHVRRQYRT